VQVEDGEIKRRGGRRFGSPFQRTGVIVIYVHYLTITLGQVP